MCEELEPRILLSAGVEGVIFDAGWEPDFASESDVDAAQIVSLIDNGQSSTSTGPTQEIVFIDSSLPDFQSLITDLEENTDGDRQIDIVVLDSERDGISQITSYLQTQENIDAIHFITHGDDGQIQLGDTQLDFGNVDNYSSELQLWQSALDENADILFYGCDVASSYDGQNLLQKISALTDADVAASDDTTGNNQLGGDWELEHNIGSIETTIALSTDLQQNWEGILPIVSFQDGVGGYSNTVDTELDSSSPNDNNGTEENVSIVSGMNEGQGLIRFDNIFGGGAGQVPNGATITSATLTVTVTSSSTAGANVELHTMLVNWDENSTWNSLGNGVQTNDTEAASAADSTLASPDATGSQTFTGLESTVQSWSDGTSTNFGWVITNDVNNDWAFSQSDEALIASHPILTINYTTNVDPVITSGAAPSVVENTTAVTTVTATDADGDTPTFSITGATADDALFSITAGGVLTFDTAPDFETPGDIGGDNTYNIEVTANDGNGGLTTQNIAITVTNTNEGAPVITSGAAPTMAENTTAVTTVTATDVDDNDVVTYSITGATADDALFSITAGGVLTFDTAPDFETPGDVGGDNTYNIEVTANDGNGGLTIQNIAVSVTNTNEGAPVITSGAAPTVAENTTAVTTVTATDVDDNDVVTFSITGATADDALFSITAGGVLTFDTTPDFETPGDVGGDNTYNIEVTANDGNGGLTVQNIAVTVTNTNEGTPVITSGAAPTVAENTTAVTTVTATDVDNNDVVTFSITGATADDALFSITPGGVLTFDATPDFETPGDIGGDNTYNIEVTANDGNGGLTIQNIAVTVTNTNEGAPVITSSAAPSVAENTTAVTTVTATDVDNNDVVTYSITGATADDALFSITAGGVLTFDTAPDFETPGDVGGDNTYNIEVTANDGNGGLTIQNIAVTVTNTNEGTPVITSGAAPTVAENTTAVTTVTATDVDNNDVVTYSITGATADEALFSITAGGVLTFDTFPDFETPGDIGGDNTYNIEVTANDGNGGLTVQNIAVTVTNTNEGAPVITSGGAISVAENTTAVSTVTASDVDSNDVLTYSITGATADDALFSITAGGVLTFDAAPDFETPGDVGGDNTYNIEVTANDGNGGLTIQNIAVTVTNTNEGTPVITSGAAPTVAENTTAVTTVTATDVDNNDVVTYSITGATADDALFSITAGGVLTFDTAPDFETPGDIGGDNTYNIEVTANDGNGGLTVQNITVTVSNTNEGTPVITSGAAISVAENTTAVTTVTATDVDSNDVLTYSITGATADDALFSITAGGVLTFDTAPNFETPGDIGGDNTYNIEVTANDGNGGLTIQNIAITVTDDNELPVITSGAAPSISENISTVTIITATDVDAGDVPTFTISGGADAGQFNIDNLSGLLTFNAAPNFEAPTDADGNNVYELQITAEDGNGGLAVQNLVVTVTNANEAPTVINQIFQVSAESPSGSIIGQVTSSDFDAGDTLTYSIASGTGSGIFAINSFTGEISVSNSGGLLSGTSQSYTLAIMVTDSTGSTAQATVTINVLPALKITSETIIDIPTITPPEATRIDVTETAEEETEEYLFSGSRPAQTSILMEKPLQIVDADSDITKTVMKPGNVPNVNTMQRTGVEFQSIRTEYLDYMAGDALKNALDNMRNDLNAPDEESFDNKFKAAIQGSGIILTAGFASWVIRGSSLLASFLSTIPVWRGLDPLPILSAFKENKEETEEENENSKSSSSYFSEDAKTKNTAAIDSGQQGSDSE